MTRLISLLEDIESKESVKVIDLYSETFNAGQAVLEMEVNEETENMLICASSRRAALTHTKVYPMPLL